ncbi:MAG TPA: thioredoxin family protein [Candidatus Dojkabacteria bacterium]|jgi:thiol-disulfide isomerase/thioredoxin
MNKILFALVGFILLALVAGGAFIFLTGDKEDSGKDNTNTTQEDTQNQDDSDTDDREVSDTEDDNTETPTENQNSSEGVYTSYSEDKLTSDTNVIFFAAKWCPSCRDLDNDINDSLGDIPSGVTILNADYDEEKDLKKKYGVTIQHTLVQVDQNGELIKKWNGLYNALTLEEVLGEIQ